MPKYSNSELNNQPENEIEYKTKKMDDQTWNGLGLTVMQTIDVALGNRQEYDDFLDYGNAMYEMRTEDRNDPWEGAANIVVPVVAAEVDEMTSRLTGSAIQPRPFVVRGNDPRASQYAHLVEQFFNSEYDKNNWYDALETGIHLAVRDGVSILETIWEERKVTRTRMLDMPVLDEDGQPVVDEAGVAVIKKMPHKVEVTEYDAPRWTAVEIRDFILIPAHAPSIEAASGVARKIYMSESDIWAMVEAGNFKAEMAEKVLSYASENNDELQLDRQGSETYTIGNRINVGNSTIVAPEGIKTQRGPVELWRVHTDAYDLDGDGYPEENIIWIHDRSRNMLGYKAYEYEGGRPFFDLSIMPRPNRIYGFSVPERTRGVQEEADATHNNRLDWQDYALNPTMYKTAGARIRPEDMGIGPGKTWDVQTPTDIGFITLQDVPQSSVQEESMLLQYASRSTGAPQTGGIPQAQAGANRQAQQNAAVQGMQTNKMLMRVRRWMLKAFSFTRALYLRYGMDQMSTVEQAQGGNNRLTVPRELIGLDYTLNIAGLGGPLDKESRRQDAMLLYQMLMQNPLVGQNLERVYGLTRMILETFDVPEVTSFIGTLEQAQEQAQQQAQAAQQQQERELQLRILSQSGVGKKSDAPKPKPALGSPTGAQPNAGGNPGAA